MFTKAYFENIREVILVELKNSTSCIKVAVAWFTDQSLFDALIEKSRLGIKVIIIINDDTINSNSSIKYEELVECGGSVYKVDNEAYGLMHNKFCVIDDDIVISGSYNWTNKAKYNNESITIIKGNQQLTSDFLVEFQNLIQIGKEDRTSSSSVEWEKQIYRLNAIKSLLLVNEYNTAIEQLRKIRKDEVVSTELYRFCSDLSDIISKKEIHSAVSLIDEFITSKSSIQIYSDPAIFALKNEVLYLKAYILSLTNQKSELLKTIQLFQIKHNEILGPITKQILECKIKLNKEDPEERNRSEEEFRRFTDNYNEVINSKPNQISREEYRELKKNYREASKLCHPDLVDDEFKEKANTIFVELSEAYQNNDIVWVKEILDHLKSDIFMEKQTTNVKEELMKTVSQLKLDLESLKDEINTITNSETYIVMNSLGDWDEYFITKKKEAENYLSELKQTLDEGNC